MKKSENVSKKTREELYALGYLFLRKRERVLMHKQELEGCGKYGVFVSREFGSWKLVAWYNTVEEREMALEEFVDIYEDVIIE